MQSFFDTSLYREFLQASAPSSLLQQALSDLVDPNNLFTFLQTPEFRLLFSILAAVVVFWIAIQLIAWIGLLTGSKQLLMPSSDKQMLYTPPSQQYVSEELLWQSSRTGFAPQLGFIDHKTEHTESTRGESTPARGGEDLP